MAGRLSLNDQAWQRVIAAMGLDAQVAAVGWADVTAAELKRHGGREPRLMAKIDHRTQLPQPLAARGWGILPTCRGGYRLGAFDMFAPLPEPPARADVLGAADDLETIRADGGLGETAALFLLQAGGTLAEFAAEERMTVTFFGRRGSSAFDFTAGTVPVEVNRAQLEIDALVEGPRSIACVEAKRAGAEDFVIRQLFYPWRTLAAECRKPIRPMFLEVADTGLRLIEYAFGDPSRYEAPRVVDQRRWVFAAHSWRRASLAELAARRSRAEPEGVPFPQADSIDRMLTLIAAIDAGHRGNDALADACGFVGRQADYYRNAARYLGFVSRSDDRLTDAGRSLLAAAPAERSFPVAEAVLSRRPFQRIFAGEDAETVIAEARPELGGDTVRRRARTARSWIAWLREREAAARGESSGPPEGQAVLF